MFGSYKLSSALNLNGGGGGSNLDFFVKGNLIFDLKNNSLNNRYLLQNEYIILDYK